jgi:hypothetical protein
MMMFVFWVVTQCEFVIDTNVSEEHVASISNPEDGGSMFLQKLVSTYKSTRRHNPEEQHPQI